MRTHSRPLTDSSHPLEQESVTETEDDFLSSEHVRVVIRCRPLNPSKEKDGSSQLKISPDGKSIDVTGASVGPRSYRFACVADGSRDQEYMFRKTGKHIVECALAGFNGAIVAYGQTGSGKTFTMQGPGLTGRHSSTPRKSRGIIQSVCETIFAHMQESEERSAAVQFEVTASYLEIYNENLVDLLIAQDTKHGKKMPKLNIREDSKGEIMVVGQTSVTVQLPEDCYKLLRDGAEQRHVGSTKMNSESSRSHAVFTLKIEKKDSDRGTRQTSRLHLVDLAGSERQKGTGATGLRLKEASGINKSLSALGNVINALSAKESSRGKGASQVRIPSCRDSKLTFLLKDSLGGNSKLCIIATVSPAQSSLDETVSTLDFAKRCTAVRNEAVVNESLTEDVAELQAEVLRLQQSMKQLRLSLSKAKTVEMELRATASPQNRINYFSGELRGGPVLADRPVKKKMEAGVQTDEDIDKLDNGQDILKSVKTVDLTGALDSLVERKLEDEDKESRIEKLCFLLANAISREKSHLKKGEEMKRKVVDSHNRWMEMLTTNEDLMVLLKSRESELADIRKQDVLEEKDPIARRLQKELDVLQVHVESNPEMVLLRHRVAVLESELEGTHDLGALSEGAKKVYEENVLELNERWLDMLKANNELTIALNERDKVLNEVRKKGLENVYDQTGERLRKDLELLQKEAEKNTETAVLRHRIMALEKELVDFAELSVAAQKEVLETGQANKLEHRPSTIDFATEIGEGDDGLSEEEVMKTLNKIPESFHEKDLATENAYRHGPSKRPKSKGMNGNPQMCPKACNCGEQSPSHDILAEVLNNELFRDVQDTSIQEFRYDAQSPRRTSELDGCIEALDASIQGLSSWSSKAAAVYSES